jgi:hypothetical protein
MRRYGLIQKGKTSMRLPGYFRPLLTMVLVVAATLPSSATTVADVNARIDRVLGNHARYQTTIDAFQQSVAAGQKEDVAAFVRYPIRVSVNGKTATINSADAFIKSYDAIMTPGIVGAIKAQKYEDLFVNSQGVMFGNGQVWLDGICLDRKCRQSVVMVVTLQDAPAS